jgi:hypothetical protein
MDESWIFTDRGFGSITKTFFIVYKRPINILLQHKRTLHNHHFASHASVPIRTTRPRSIEWTCDQLDEPNQLINTLQVIASSHVDKLNLRYLVEQVIISNDKVKQIYNMKILFNENFSKYKSPMITISIIKLVLRHMVV